MVLRTQQCTRRTAAIATATAAIIRSHLIHQIGRPRSGSDGLSTHHHPFAQFVASDIFGTGRCGGSGHEVCGATVLGDAVDVISQYSRPAVIPVAVIIIAIAVAATAGGMTTSAAIGRRAASTALLAARQGRHGPKGPNAERGPRPSIFAGGGRIGLPSAVVLVGRGGGGRIRPRGGGGVAAMRMVVMVASGAEALDEAQGEGDVFVVNGHGGDGHGDGLWLLRTIIAHAVVAVSWAASGGGILGGIPSAGFVVRSSHLSRLYCDNNILTR